MPALPDTMPAQHIAELRLEDPEAHHLRTVLRARVGDTIGLLDGVGGAATACITAMPGRRGPISLRLLALERHPLPTLRPVLYVAPPRAKLMGLLVKQATELGVAVIQPIITERTVGSPDADDVDGWLADAREACKQSGNPWLPRIAPPEKLAPLLAAPPPPGYIGHVTASPTQPPSAHAPPATGAVALWIGPEGGFTDAEAAAIQAAGAEPLRLGPWVLRVETAVAAGLAVLHARAFAAAAASATD